MELLFILFMIAAGGGLALFVMIAMGVSGRGEERSAAIVGSPQDSLAASLLFHIISAGGVPGEEALRQLRREGSMSAPVTPGIDVTSWAETYARGATAEQRTSLLEKAVQLVASTGRPVPLRQYAALLDLSFGLGFQTDALAKLRRVYGFDYVDHARDGRSRSADRGHVPRVPERVEELLATLGISGHPSRQEIGSAYRKLVIQHHPDRFHAASPEARDAAASRFIEITRAYEKLLLTIRD